MSESKKKMSYGFYNTSLTTHNPVRFTEQGSQVLIKHYGGGTTRAWLLGESEGFKETGCYDVVVPEEDGGVVAVHWDNLQPIIVPTV